jgi:signal transduction histidine kinase/ligand-binding sensor domain-containing protein/DNA-binding response OmpR family regulator
MKGILKRFLGISILLWCFLGSFAQLNSNITRYSTEDGLSHDGVLCITKDRDGFMWFGTFDGINRFDGHNFVVYKSRPGDTSNLLSNKIKSIVEDKIGYLWIQTFDHKIYRFDKKKEQFAAISDGHFKHLFNDQVVVDEMIADDENGIWLRTQAQGLYYVFNKTSGEPVVQHYGKSEGGSFRINGDIPQFIYQAGGGKIWIGTEGGLNCVRTVGDRKYRRVAFLPSVEKLLATHAFSCFTAKNYRLYFGTENGEILIYNQSEKTFQLKNILSGTRFNAMCYAKTGNLYISTTKKGLLTVNPVNFKIKLSGLSLDDTYYSLFEDKYNRLWIEPEKTGIIKYEPGKASFKFYSQQKDFTSSGRGYGVQMDSKGILWIRMKAGGFGYYNSAKDEVEYFYDQPGSNQQQFSNILTSIYIEPSGVIWLSGKDGGINKIVSLADKFNYKNLVNQPQIRSANEVRAMMKDAKGRLWICSKEGQVRVLDQGKQVAVLPERHELGLVYTILEDSKKNVWLGTKGNGVFRAEPVTADCNKYKLQHFQNDKTNPNSLSSNLVYSIIEDRKSRIWVGTLGGGLNLFTGTPDQPKFENYNNGFKSYPFSWAKVIRHLCEDQQGKIWVSTSNGLLIFNPDVKVKGAYKFDAYRKVRGEASSIGSNSVQYVYKQPNGQMWVATFGGGLNQVIAAPDEPGKIGFKSYTTVNGLSNDVVLSITSDKQGKLWLATENGLSQFDPQHRTFKNYDSHDGLPKTGFAEATAFTDQAGKLYFGCIDGYISFDPLKVADQKMQSKMAITRLQLYYKDMLPETEGSPLQQSINETDELTLAHDQNVISLDYAVLDYRASNKITYAYKLEGFDKIWHLVNDQRRATYTNIPPGNYTFKVKSTSKDLFTILPEKNLIIRVLPPFYLTWWAYLTYAIIAVIAFLFSRRILITMIKLRNKVLVEQKLTEVKLAFFTNISHELRTPLTLIVNPLAEISKTEQLSGKGREYLEVINRNANRMIRFINQLLDFRKVQEGKVQLRIAEVDLTRLVGEIAAHFTAIAEEKQIQFRLPDLHNGMMAWVDEEKIDIILYNLLSNAFKFTPNGKAITISLSEIADAAELELIVKDEGRGVANDKLEEIFDVYYEGHTTSDNHLKGTGIGLGLARALAESQQARLWAEHNPTGGLIFKLRIKSGHAHFDQRDIDLSAHADLQNLLPVEYQSEGQVSAESMLSDHQMPHILLVEDNPDLRDFLSLKLQGLYRLSTAPDGLEGLKMAESLLPDLIISDVMMPNLDGIQMLDQIRQHELTSHIPVILLTARSSVQHQIEGLKYGADLYLTKPFHADFLIASIQNLIQSRKRLYEQLSAGLDKKIMKLEPSEVVITSRDEQFLKQTIDIVEAGMQNPEFNIDDVAVAIGMGRTTFYKKLKSLSSLSPVEFVRDMRLKRSKQLLDSGSYTVSDAAYLAGFNSLSYFSTCFKDQYKMTPSAYLKTVRTVSF